jgi:hypothetical protein
LAVLIGLERFLGLLGASMTVIRVVRGPGLAFPRTAALVVLLLSWRCLFGCVQVRQLLGVLVFFEGLVDLRNGFFDLAFGSRSCSSFGASKGHGRR